MRNRILECQARKIDYTVNLLYKDMDLLKYLFVILKVRSVSLLNFWSKEKCLHIKYLEKLVNSIQFMHDTHRKIGGFLDKEKSDKFAEVIDKFVGEFNKEIMLKNVLDRSKSYSEVDRELIVDSEVLMVICEYIKRFLMPLMKELGLCVEAKKMYEDIKDYFQVVIEKEILMLEEVLWI